MPKKSKHQSAVGDRGALYRVGHLRRQTLVNYPDGIEDNGAIAFRKVHDLLHRPESPENWPRDRPDNLLAVWVWASTDGGRLWHCVYSHIITTDGVVCEKPGYWYIPGVGDIEKGAPPQ